MANKLGVSGSVIYSDEKQFSELFWDGIKHIEIGEFESYEALDKFLEMSKERNVEFGIYFPVLRSGSKYDLIEKVYYEPEDAWQQLELETNRMVQLGAKYMLVHFPFFKGPTSEDVNELIEDGLKKLKYLQNKYGLDFVCEPKLGVDRSDAGINYLNDFPIEVWDKYNIGICIDIGDYIIANEAQCLRYMEKWKKYIKVVHLHNIHYEGDRYIWIPVHPSQEHNNYHKVEKIIRFLAQCNDDIIFVFEHTPETKPNNEFVNEGYNWVQSLVSNK